MIIFHYIHMKFSNVIYIHIYAYILAGKKTPSFINAMICLETQKRVTYIESIKVKIQIQKDG